MQVSKRTWSLPLALLALALLIGAIVVAQVVENHLAASASGPYQGRLAGQRYKLLGHIAPAMKRYTPMHASNGQQEMRLAVSLNLRNQAQLDALLAAQNNPQSTLYHRYLTPQDFMRRFAPTQEDVNRVTAYLRSNRLQIVDVSTNRQIVNIRGSMDNVEKTFSVSISDYNIDGRVAYAPLNDPSVPADMAGMISNVAGLENVARYHHHAQLQPNPGKPRQGPQGGFTPTDLRTAYDVNPLLQAGNNGANQTVALFELDGYTPSDVNTYLQQYNLGAPRYSNVLVDGATNTAGQGAIEVELDMEVVSAIAPGATQKIYIGPNSNAGVIDTYNKIVTDNTAKVVSISWGLCETSSGNAMLDSLSNVFKQGAAQGQAFFAASGDSGAFDCNDNQLAVDSPASDPNVVGVGGTALQVDANGAYQSESVWSNPNAQGRGPNGVGGGGGISNHFIRPAYQNGVQNNANRTVPDVSADADPNTGYSVFVTGQWGVVGGTSAAAPLWAGIATDVNQSLQGQNKPTLGSAHTVLYNLFKTQQAQPPYHDVTTGTNLHYPATQGYDLASGMGTPDAGNIAQDLGGGNSGGGGTGGGGTGGTTTTQLLNNGDFEKGQTGWQESSAAGFQLIDGTRVHGGSASGYFCGYNNCADQLSQTITLPANAKSMTLSFWLSSATGENGGCNDTLTAQISDTREQVITKVATSCNANSDWQQVSGDVSKALLPFKGQQVQVVWKSQGNASSPSAFFIDDAAFTVSS